MTDGGRQAENFMVRDAPALTVLHVDDQPVDQYRRRKALERAGFAVVDAGTGADALAAIAAHAPDIALLDVRLPDTTGFDLTREIKERASQANCDIAVVLISAYFTESEYRVQGLRSGADAYLIEPLSDAELTASIAAVGRRVEQLKCARRNQDLLDRRTEELRIADQAKNDFLVSVVHELRQPINAALAALAVMKARVDRTKGEHARDAVQRQLQQISRITEDLLDATRIVRRQVPLQLEPHDLRSIVRRSVETVQPAAADSGVRMTLMTPDAPVLASSDESRLEQVVVNLLSNAVRYTPSGGDVRIGVEADDATAVIRIRDSGEGIEPERLARIFDLFVRGGSSQGLGIGLAVAKSLVEAHGGTLRARSEGPGRGSEFTVTLPRISIP